MHYQKYIMESTSKGDLSCFFLLIRSSKDSVSKQYDLIMMAISKTFFFKLKIIDSCIFLTKSANN